MITILHSNSLEFYSNSSIVCVCVARCCMCVSYVLFQQYLSPIEKQVLHQALSALLRLQTVTHSGGPRQTHLKPINVAVNVKFCRCNSSPPSMHFFYRHFPLKGLVPFTDLHVWRKWRVPSIQSFFFFWTELKGWNYVILCCCLSLGAKVQ